MTEQAPNSPPPIGPDPHQKIAAQIEAAAAILPEAAVSKTQPLGGLDELRIKSDTGSVRLTKDGMTPDIAGGGLLIEGSVTGKPVYGAYGFRSEAAPTGPGRDPRAGGVVEEAVVQRKAVKRDPVTGDIADISVYRHDFSPANKDKAAQLITALAIKQAARDAGSSETARKAA